MFVSTVLLVLLLVASTFMGGNLNAVGGWRLESFDTRVPWYQIQINQEIPFQVKPAWEGLLGPGLLGPLLSFRSVGGRQDDALWAGLSGGGVRLAVICRGRIQSWGIRLRKTR